MPVVSGRLVHILVKTGAYPSILISCETHEKEAVTTDSKINYNGNKFCNRSNSYGKNPKPEMWFTPVGWKIDLERVSTRLHTPSILQRNVSH